jgi:hypothetical protein
MTKDADDIPGAVPPLAQRHAPNLFAAIRNRIAPHGGVELDLPRRKPIREPPRFDE